MTELIAQKTKRTRAPNFTAAEITLLLSLIDKYKYIIDSTKSDGATIRKKNKAWMNILQEFNAHSISYIRTVKSILSCYRSQRKKNRKRYSDGRILVHNGLYNADNSYEECITGDWENVSKIVGESVESMDSFVETIKIEEEEEEEGDDSHLDYLDEIKNETGNNDGDDVASITHVPRKSPQTLQFQGYRKRLNDSLYETLNASHKEKVQQKKTLSSSCIALNEKKIELLDIQKQVAILDLQEKTRQSEHNSILRKIEQETKEAELQLLQLKFKLMKRDQE